MQKIVLGTLVLVHILVSAWILFIPESIPFAHISENSSFSVKVVLLSTFIIYMLRLFFGTFVFLKRAMPWSEAAIVGIWFGAIFYSMSFGALTPHFSSTMSLIFGSILFLLGSYLNTTSEWQRYIWKKHPENKGKLYTQGLFGYSMHINYFGDTVFTFGFALISGNWFTFIIPVLMAAMFLFEHIPRIDKYLAEKYGTDFKNYAAKTKKFIPWIY